MTDASLQIAAGFATSIGPKAENQDFGGVHLGAAAEQREHGMIAVVADGVSGGKGGRVAAELAVSSFIEAYLDQNPLNGVAANAVKALRSYNQWLHSRSRADPAMEGAATTFTALILRGREAKVVHVGDSRAWLFRDGRLSQLTHDHALTRPGLTHVLYRAVGIEAEVKLDVASVGLQPHDRLLLTTDGVHGVLTPAELSRLLARRASPETDAKALLAAVEAEGARDNATVVLVDVIDVGPPDWEVITAEAQALAFMPAPGVGETIDDYVLERLVADGRFSRVFVAADVSARGGGRAVVIKFPKIVPGAEAGARRAFLREAFVGQRVDSAHVGKVLTLEDGRQTRLYVVQPVYRGETLEARLSRDGAFDIVQGVAVAAKLARGVADLHRLAVIHRDIKPDNVILEREGGLKLIDLGVARLPRIETLVEDEVPGTPGYRAPEMQAGEAGDAATDQFALGVTLYRLFTDAHPWGEGGEVRPERPPTPPTRHRPDMPAWLEAAILKMLAAVPADRFEDVAAVVRTLESGNAMAAAAPRPLGLMERDPVRVWQAISLVLFALLLLSVMVG